MNAREKRVVEAMILGSDISLQEVLAGDFVWRIYSPVNSETLLSLWAVDGKLVLLNRIPFGNSTEETTFVFSLEDEELMADLSSKLLLHACQSVVDGVTVDIPFMKVHASGDQFML